MLKGSRDAILRKMQPISIHGQLSFDIHFVDVEDPSGQPRVARVGAETVPQDLQPGDRIQLDYLMGAVTAVRRAPKPG